MGPDRDLLLVVPNQWDLVIEPASEDSRITTRPLYDTKVGVRDQVNSMAMEDWFTPWMVLRSH